MGVTGALDLGRIEAIEREKETGRGGVERKRSRLTLDNVRIFLTTWCDLLNSQ